MQSQNINTTPYYEICLENHTNLVKALAHPLVARLELCDNLAVGGTTVSYGVACHCAKLAYQAQKPLMVIIRPRAGNFVYTTDELSIMLHDISLFQTIKGISGFVIGALTHDNQLDKALLEPLIAACKPKLTTFHMAFDSIPANSQYASIDWLASMGVNHILLHGGSATSPIGHNISHLQTLASHAADNITLIVGKGVHYANAQAIHQQLPQVQLHGTAIVQM